MQENNLVKYTMTYGLYLGLAFSVVVITMKFRGIIHFPGDAGSVINVMLLSTGMMLFGRKYRDSFYEGILSYKNAFRFTFSLSVFSSVIYAFFLYWYYAKIEVVGISSYIDQMEMLYVESKMVPESDIKTVIDLYRKTLTPGMMASVLFFLQLLLGIFVGILASFFIKTPNELNHTN